MKPKDFRALCFSYLIFLMDTASAGTTLNPTLSGSARSGGVS